MTTNATDKQIAYYTSLVTQAAALDPELAAVAQTAIEAFPARSRADASAAIDRAKATVERLQAAKGAPAPIDLSGVPAGLYAVPGGDTRLKVEIDKPENGKWAGWVFVKDGAVYGEGKRYGKQAPGKAYQGEIQDALRAIVADPREAAAAYGRLTNTCGLCRRPLEDEASVARGIGPVCAKKF